MEKDSALYQLMDIRMNGVMNGITNGDGEYQAILRRSDEYSGKLERVGLPVDIRQLIDHYVSEQNALGSRYGMLAYLLGFSDCKTMFLGNACLQNRNRRPKEVNPNTRSRKKGLKQRLFFRSLTRSKTVVTHCPQYRTLPRSAPQVPPIPGCPSCCRGTRIKFLSCFSNSLIPYILKALSRFHCSLISRIFP